MEYTMHPIRVIPVHLRFRVISEFQFILDSDFFSNNTLILIVLIKKNCDEVHLVISFKSYSNSIENYLKLFIQLY